MKTKICNPVPGGGDAAGGGRGGGSNKICDNQMKKPTIRNLSISSIHPCPTQPRKEIARAPLEALASDIRSGGFKGVIQVRPSPHYPREWEIVAGERRWRAAAMAGLKEIRAEIFEMDDREAFLSAVNENELRVSLSVLERAMAYADMVEMGLTVSWIAKHYGVSDRVVQEYIALTSLPEPVKQALHEGKIVKKTAEAIMGIRDAQMQNDALALAISLAGDVGYRAIVSRIKTQFVTRIDREERWRIEADALRSAGHDHCGTECWMIRLADKLRRSGEYVREQSKPRRKWGLPAGYTWGDVARQHSVPVFACPDDDGRPVWVVDRDLVLKAVQPDVATGESSFFRDPSEGIAEIRDAIQLIAARARGDGFNPEETQSAMEMVSNGGSAVSNAISVLGLDVGKSDPGAILARLLAAHVLTGGSARDLRKLLDSQ